MKQKVRVVFKEKESVLNFNVSNKIMSLFNVKDFWFDDYQLHVSLLVNDTPSSSDPNHFCFPKEDIAYVERYYEE